MGRVGLEPTLELIQMVFETIASTGSATSPYLCFRQFQRPLILAFNTKARQP
jgi:hypothetical protein